MKLELQEAGGSVPGPVDDAVYIRRSWTLIAVYDVTAAAGVGATIAILMFALAISGAWQRPGERPPAEADALGFAAVVLVVVTTIALLAQLVTGPFVFTGDVVCRTCHRRQSIRRAPFFAGRYSRPARCGCGGRFEPAILWERQT